jgi:putative transposase
MIERVNPALPISQQCRLLALPPLVGVPQAGRGQRGGSRDYGAVDRHYLARPYYGSRRMAAWLATQGHHVNRKRVQRLMRLLGLAAIYQRPNTSKPAKRHKICPFLPVG